MEANLKSQMRILRGLYRCLWALLQQASDYPEADQALKEVQDAFSCAERGRWRHWYRGDIKVGVGDLRERIRYLNDERGQTRLSGAP